MKAIILAAGVGQRLETSTEGKPKCLLDFNGVSLLHRHLINLHLNEVTDVTVVTGFEAALIDAEIDRAVTGVKPRTVFNPDYTDGSIISLHCAADTLISGADIILMDADVLYDPAILQRLLASKHGNCLLLDEEFEQGDEPVRICISKGHPVEFRKKIAPDPEWELQGESVGFLRFSGSMATELARCVRGYIDRQQLDAPCEEAIRDLIRANSREFGYENITGLSWIEIDFPEDIVRAETDILPNLHE